MPKNKSTKIVIDTNLWISFVISKKLNGIQPLLFSHNLRILFSNELIVELRNTIEKPKLAPFFKENALDEMLEVFDPFIDLINIKSKLQICRDPKDDFLLNLAKDGKADFLLTGDKDLLEIRVLGKTKILKLNEFLDKANNYNL